MLLGLFLYAALLPFQLLWLPIALTYAVFWFGYLLSFEQYRFKNLVGNKWFWLFTTLYLWQIIGLSYSNNVDIGVKDIVVKISMFLWPLGMASLGKLKKGDLSKIIAVFVVATIVSAASGLVLSFIAYLNTGDVKEFMFGNLAHWPMLPNHYLGLYVSVAIAFMSLFLFKNWKTLSGYKRNGTVLGVLFLLMILFLFAVRIQLIAFPITLFLSLFLLMRGKPFFKSFLLWSIGIFILFVGVLFFQPSSKRKILETIDEVKSINTVVNKKQTNHRVYIWKYGAEVIQENFLIGTGTGDADLALHKKLKNCEAPFWMGNKKYFLYDKVYNYHNSFLQHFANNGVLAFILFLSIILSGLVWAIKVKNYYAFSFLLLFALSILTESMLERQAGVYFFSFFFGLLIINKRKVEERSEK